MRTNEEQLDLFADLIEPCGEILSDKEIAEAFKQGEKLKGIKIGIKGHKKAIIEILARIDGVDVGAYKVPTPPVLAVKILKLFNDPDIAALFMPQAQNETETCSGSATENTEAADH